MPRCEFKQHLEPKPVLHMAGENDPLVRFAWQQRTIDELRKINRCGEGQPCGEHGTLYPSPIGTPVVTYIHPGGHELPKDVPPAIVKFFKEHVLNKKDFAPATKTMPGTAAVVNAVIKDKNAIGFGGAAYAVGIKYAKIKKTADAAAYEPTEENVKSGDYPISRFLYLYTRSKPTGDIKKFIDWILSSEGQAVVSKVGYFPVR